MRLYSWVKWCVSVVCRLVQLLWRWVFKVKAAHWVMWMLTWTKLADICVCRKSVETCWSIHWWVLLAIHHICIYTFSTGYLIPSSMAANNLVSSSVTIQYHPAPLITCGRFSIHIMEKAPQYSCTPAQGFWTRHITIEAEDVHAHTKLWRWNRHYYSNPRQSCVYRPVGGVCNLTPHRRTFHKYGFASRSAVFKNAQMAPQ